VLTMIRSASSFNAVFDQNDGENLHSDMFSRTVSMLSRGSLLQKNHSHSFKAALRDVLLVHPPVKDVHMSSANDYISIENETHARKSNSYRKMHRTGICVGRGKVSTVTSPFLQLYSAENDAKIFDRARAIKPFAKKASASFQERSASLALKNVRMTVEYALVKVANLRTRRMIHQRKCNNCDSDICPTMNFNTDRLDTLNVGNTGKP
jgi:hypothetical protein